jgi:DNA-binding NarL/FixJ family response regulator/DNA-binding MarR family transcriptional regulator
VGLTAIQEQIYLVLVRRGPTSVARLAGRAGLDETRVRRAVSALVREGFVHLTPAPEERVVPVPPELAVEQLVRRRHDELERARDAARRLADEAYRPPGSRRTEELIEIVVGRAAVGRAFERVQLAASREMRVLVAPPYAIPKAVNRTQLERQAAGVVYRAVYDRSGLDDADFAGTVATHLRSGEQARIVEALPTKLAVADRALALLPLAWTTSAHDAALLVHPCGLLDALVALFERVWTQATPLAPASADGLSGDPTITVEDRQLLSLLVAGLTDDAAGARLGMSRRTVVRRVQQLMERTNSRSRLQLGWHARERRWL